MAATSHHGQGLPMKRRIIGRTIAAEHLAGLHLRPHTIAGPAVRRRCLPTIADRWAGQHPRLRTVVGWAVLLLHMAVGLQRAQCRTTVEAERLRWVAAASGEAARHPTVAVAVAVRQVGSVAVATFPLLAVVAPADSVEAVVTSQPPAAMDITPAVAAVTAMAEATTAADTKL